MKLEEVDIRVLAVRCSHGLDIGFCDECQGPLVEILSRHMGPTLKVPKVDPAVLEACLEIIGIVLAGALFWHLVSKGFVLEVRISRKERQAQPPV